MVDSLVFMTVNRTQALVLGFFLVVWVSLLVILVAAPEVFDQALRLPTIIVWWSSPSWRACLASSGSSQ